MQESVHVSWRRRNASGMGVYRQVLFYNEAVQHQQHCKVNFLMEGTMFEAQNEQERIEEMEDVFCLDDYDCIGFDMDHTVVQYHIEELFKLIYHSLAKYLVDIIGYDKHLLDEDFLKYEDYSLRGLIFEVETGNFVKLDQNGYVLRACHGMREMNDEEIESFYGKERQWCYFDELRSSVHHGAHFKCFENFFEMPFGALCARIVDLIDETQGRQKEYKFWQDVVQAVANSFGSKCFSEHRGYFFSTIGIDPGKYVKKCPTDVMDWLKNLKNAGKMLFLITQSHVDYAKFLMEYAMGEDWLDLFSLAITSARKPDFFIAKPSERPFRYADTALVDTVCNSLEMHKCYAQGNAVTFEETMKSKLGKENIKITYFGDSPKSDIFPPSKYRGWDTVAILEEMEAEEIHFQRHSACSQNGTSTKKPKLSHLLKEEKIIVASKQWGSFFRHDRNHETETLDCHHESINTFWADIIRQHCKIAIPLLDYITDLPIGHKFKSFSDSQLGFYPSPPSTVVHKH